MLIGSDIWKGVGDLYTVGLWTGFDSILIYYIGYVTVKEYVKICSQNTPYLIFRYVNGYFEEIHGNKYITPVPVNESKEKIKNYEELWIKIRYLIRSITKYSDDYDYDEK